MTNECDLFKELLGLDLEGLELDGLDPAAFFEISKTLMGDAIVGEEVDAAPDGREDAS